jgi:PIF1-like helicase
MVKNVNTMERGLDLEEDALPNMQFMPSFTEEGLQEVIASMTPWAERNHGCHAVYIANQARIFHNEDLGSSWALELSRNPVSNTTGSSMQKFLMWKTQMDANVNQQNSGTGIPHTEQNDRASATVTGYQGNIDADGGNIFPYNPDAPEAIACLNGDSEIAENALPPVDSSQLKTDQRRAYGIVIWHLDQTLSGASPPPLRMILYGEGGTGKSKVIQTITQAFTQRGVAGMLLKSAYTGVAASLIDGKTTLTIGMISQNGHPLSSQTKAKLQAFWKYIVYLIIDKYSMISKSFLAKLSEKHRDRKNERVC